jgi:hypothetical protein
MTTEDTTVEKQPLFGLHPPQLTFTLKKAAKNSSETVLSTHKTTHVTTQKNTVWIGYSALLNLEYFMIFSFFARILE